MWGGIELIVRPECNQKCEYCYISRYGDDLYPRHERVSNETILHNLDMFLTYIYQEKNIFITRWELFAGDMFYDGLYFDILDIFYKHFSILKERFAPLLNKNEISIIAPCNFSFIENDETVNRLNEYILKFRHEFHAEVGFSVSTDGKYAIDTREMKPLNDEYFDKIFNFMEQHHRIGVHPMISASNIDCAIENYEWWKEVFKTKFKNNFCAKNFLPSYLEVRNNEWTTEKIQKYIQFIDHVFNDRLQMCNNDVDHLAYHLFKGDGKNDTLAKLSYNDLIRLDVNEAHYDDISCSIQSLFHVTLNNLSIVPCHRLAYKQLSAGNFICDEKNEKIIGVESYNIVPLIDIKAINNQDQPKCFSCIYSPYCVKGCLGAQYEASGELFMPALSVCELLKSKYNYLLYLYKSSGVLDSAIRQGLLSDQDLQYMNLILEKETARERSLVTQCQLMKTKTCS